MQPLTLDDVKEFARWHHLNEMTIAAGKTPSDSEIDFEVIAWNKIKAALTAAPASAAEPVGYTGQYTLDELARGDPGNIYPNKAASYIPLYAAAPASVAEPVCAVAEMKTSAGSDYFVSVRVGDREITPHAFKERWKAEYEVAEWKWLLNGGDKPDLMAYGPKARKATS